MRCVLFSLLVFAVAVVGTRVSLQAEFKTVSDPLVITQDAFDEIISRGVPWKPVGPGEGPFASTTVSQFQRLLTSTEPSENQEDLLPIKEPDLEENKKLPSEFDARQKWWGCETVTVMRDQGDCGSCWAFGSTSAISDRVCIHSQGRNQTLLSAVHVLTCCTDCWDDKVKGGCEGGSAELVYRYWRDKGIVTGDNYGSLIGCQPYPLPINLYHGSVHVAAPQCLSNCTVDHTRSYESDKHYALDVYMLKPNDVKGAMREIMKNGPITAHFKVYDDFAGYKEGVYVRTSEKLLGGHFVEIIGWGTENGTDYWTARNSWNRLWGLHGYFKVRRGTQESGFERRWMAGMPRV